MNANELQNPTAIQAFLILSRCNLGRADSNFTTCPEKGASTAALRGRAERKLHLNLLFLWFLISFSVEKLHAVTWADYSKGWEVRLWTHPSFLLAHLQQFSSSLFRGCYTEQGMAEARSVPALSPRLLNKPGTIRFTTVCPAYRFVNLAAILSSPFHPCWFLAVGSVCCEHQPLDPVGVFHPDAIFLQNSSWNVKKPMS